MNKLKSFSSALLFTVILTVSGIAQAQSSSDAAMEWNVDKAHSHIGFDIRHIFTPVSGIFSDYTADINFNPENLDASSLNLEIMVNSINTFNERRNGHLKSDDFFNVEQYPTITFTSDDIEQTGDNSYVAHGELTIKDVTKEVDLPFTLLGVKDHPQKENTKVAGFTIDYTIDRNEYNVGVGDYSSTAVIGGDVDINIALEVQHEMASSM